MCHPGYEDIVDLLIDNGAKSNIVDKNGNTPKDRALISGYSGIVNLLEGGFSVSRRGIFCS